ncbi:MAG TPA: hypothetical protein VJR89_24865 [Polyangiales bacterium]|nr:hypothetical protein [Polyangiales bacterium]
MIRAFAPGMTMQDPLAQTPSNFDVRHEPTEGELRLPAPDSTAPRPSGAAEVTEAESEVARLEQLLSSRTRERRDLALELERRGALLRDAVSRLSELAPRVSENQLQKERDAALARAVEAEVARAEANFKLYEVLGRLLALGGERPALSQPSAAREPSLASRLLELEERKDMAEARVMLLEDELARERERVAAAVRDRVETAEHFELEISQTRAEARKHQLDAERARAQLEAERERLQRERQAALQEAQRALDVLREQAEQERAGFRSELENDRQAQLAQLEAERAELQANSEREREALHAASNELTRVRAELQGARDTLVGELDGQRFRLIEAEQALRSNTERLSRTQHQLRELEHKLDAARSERANQSARAEALAVQLQEKPELEELRADLGRERAARAALAVQLTAASPEGADYAAQQARLEALRACLLEMRRPLVEFEASLNDIARGEGGVGASVTIDAEMLTALEEELRAKDLRIQELETALRELRSERDKPQRDVARDVSTLKGELIDVRANATRLSDELAKERARRRKMAVTVRALQAATESGEAPGPWIEELVSVINEGGSSLPPKS